MNLNNKDVHSGWYNNWEAIESSVLVPSSEFKNYRILAAERKKNIDELINLNSVKSIDWKNYEEIKSDLESKYPHLYSIITKLKQDKSILR